MSLNYATVDPHRVIQLLLLIVGAYIQLES